MASGWNLWVWLECIGVVCGCCCKEVYTVDILIIIIAFPYSTCISSFLAAASLFLCSIFNMFFLHSMVHRETERIHVLLLMANKSKTVLYRAPTFSLLALHGEYVILV